MKSLSRSPLTHVVTADQCMSGLVTPIDGGGTAPAKKPTTFMTSSRQMADLLMTRCDKSHAHQPLVNGRCFNASCYPLKLIQTILRGIRATADAEDALAQRQKDRVDMIASMDMADLTTSKEPVLASLPPSKLRRASGGAMPVDYANQLGQIQLPGSLPR